MKNYKLLMLTTLIISGCSICYELIISAVSSYLVGDSTLQYSVTIGLYMCAMGLGSYLSKFMKNNLFNWFVSIEIGVGAIGGVSALILFLANLYLESYQLVMYLEIIIIGTLVGAEIPILTRIIEGDEENLRVTISSIFSFDYIGGLVGSIAFPLLLLPQLGYFATAFLTGTMNLVAAMLIIYKYAGRIKRVWGYKIATAVLFAGMVIGMLFSENISNYIENGLYRDNVILSEHTKYQHIVMTKHRDDVRLYIDGNIQFCSMDEYRYHEALVHVPMAKAEKKDRVLVLGGGDGMAVRELLKYEDTHITLVDLDEEMIRICSENKNINKLNDNSLKSDRLTIVIQDAYKFLENNTEPFDVIIVDLPDPNNEALNKLYTNVFYRLCGNSLTENGIMTVQSTSPYYASKAFWCVNKTLESEGFFVKPYHLQVPAFGDWGFNLASKKEMDDVFQLDVETRYLDENNVEALFCFGKDELAANVEINGLSRPRMIEYYMEAVRNWE
ncbi:MAG: polyamine aminopropyltransferase [Lachnospiraceae bacterium]|nr:polyamine aminopropyltransferase [Lachnospiraceae bacterium]